MTGTYTFQPKQSLGQMLESIKIASGNTNTLDNFINSIKDGTVTGRYNFEKTINISWMPDKYKTALTSMFFLNQDNRPTSIELLNHLSLDLPPSEASRHSSSI